MPRILLNPVNKEILKVILEISFKIEHTFLHNLYINLEIQNYYNKICLSLLIEFSKLKQLMNMININTFVKLIIFKYSSKKHTYLQFGQMSKFCIHFKALQI